MPPKSQVDKIIADLQALSEQLGGLSDLEKAASRAKADLDSLNEQRERAHDQAKEAQNLLTQAQVNAQRQFDLDMNRKQEFLKSLTERVAALEERAKELTEEVRVKGLQLQSIENSFNEARRRLAG